MGGYSNGGSAIGRIATWLVVGIVAILALKAAAAIAGAVVGIGFFLLFTVGPVLVIGWLVLKVLRAFARSEDAVV